MSDRTPCDGDGEDAVGRAEGDAPRVGETGTDTDLDDSIEQVFAAALERQVEEQRRLTELLELLTEQLELLVAQRDEVETRLATVRADLLERVEGLLDDGLADLRRAAERLTEEVARLRELEPPSAEIASGEGRRPLLADIARAFQGYVCPTCGFVARTHRGLTVHERTHTAADRGDRAGD